VTFLACVHLALFLALSLSPGNSLVSSRCDHVPYGDVKFSISDRSLGHNIDLGLEETFRLI